MPRNIVLRPSSSLSDRRQPLLGKSRFAEVAGGTTAECAAVFCCGPCGLVDLLVLAVYKLPAGLCRKAMRKKRRRRLAKMGLLPPRKCGFDEKEMQANAVAQTAAMVSAMELDKEVFELDKEMMEQFYGGGFWRSSSRRSDFEAC